MTLNVFAAQQKKMIHEALLAGSPPPEGTYAEPLYAAARLKGTPQIGSTTFRPNTVILEFVYRDSLGASLILPVTIPVPERIVFLPVPAWVIETIWQGDIDGSYHFESDAKQLLQDFQDLLSPEPNAAFFEKQMAKRRE